jgi:hypothetical protein
MCLNIENGDIRRIRSFRRVNWPKEILKASKVIVFTVSHYRRISAPPSGTFCPGQMEFSHLS